MSIIFTKMEERTIILSEKLLTTKSAALEAVKHDGYLLRYVPQYADDYDVVLAAVSKCGGALKNASDRLKDNKSIILVAISQNLIGLEYVSDRLKDDKEIILAAVTKFGNKISYASDRLRNDREVILTALTQDGQSFAYIPDIYKDDYEITLAAVKSHGYAIQFASNRLKHDRNISLVACSSHGCAYRFLVQEFKNDIEIVFAAVSSNGSVLGHVPDPIRAQYPELDSIAIKSSAHAFPYVSLNLQQNYEIVLDAVSRAGAILRLVPKFKENRTIVLAAVKNYGYALEYASAKLRNDKEVVLAAVSYNHKNTGSISPLVYASDEMRNDYEVAHTAIINNFHAWYHISNTLKNNREFLFDIAKSPAYIAHILYRYKNLLKDDDLLIEVIKTQYSYVKPYQWANLVLEQPITNIKLIHKLVNIDLPEYIILHNMYFTLRRAKCVANMNIPWAIKDEILLWLFQ